VLLVGLTGGIGSGKSTVSAMLAERGAYIVDADAIARELQQPGSPVLAAMAERFGAHVLDDEGALDRAAVANIVFGDDDESAAALRDLNGIVHPALQNEIRARIAAREATNDIVVLDFPLLAENPRDDLAATIGVDVDPETAIERLVLHRGKDAADDRRRSANQTSREQRRSIATHVLDNSGDVDFLEAQVEHLFDDLCGLRDA